MPPLPTPATTTEVWLAAVHEELVGLRQDLKVARGGEQPPAEPGKALLEEPAPQSPRRSAKGTR